MCPSESDTLCTSLQKRSHWNLFVWLFTVAATPLTLPKIYYRERIRVARSTTHCKAALKLLTRQPPAMHTWNWVPKLGEDTDMETFTFCFLDLLTGDFVTTSTKRKGDCVTILRRSQGYRVTISRKSGQYELALQLSCFILAFFGGDTPINRLGPKRLSQIVARLLKVQSR